MSFVILHYLFQIKKALTGVRPYFIKISSQILGVFFLILLFLLTYFLLYVPIYNEIIFSILLAFNELDQKG